MSSFALRLAVLPSVILLLFVVGRKKKSDETAGTSGSIWRSEHHSGGHSGNNWIRNTL